MKVINGIVIDWRGNVIDENDHTYRANGNNIISRLFKYYRFALDPKKKNVYIVKLFVTMCQIHDNLEFDYIRLLDKLESLAYDNSRDTLIFILDFESSAAFNHNCYVMMNKMRPNYKLERIFWADERINTMQNSPGSFRHLNFVSQTDEIHSVEHFKDIIHPLIKNKLFLSLNRRIKEHRIMLVGRLIEEDLQDRSYISWFNNLEGRDYREWTLYATRFLNDERRQKYIEYLSKDLTLDQSFQEIDSGLQRGSSKDLDRYYLDSYISLVTETRFSEEEISVTEKTFKPIAHKHPFIIIGQYKFLEYVRKLGYKTFHPYINESYDTIKNHHDRFEAIIKEIKRIANMNQSELINIMIGLQDITEFNYNIHNKNNMYLDYKLTSFMKKIDQFSN